MFGQPLCTAVQLIGALIVIQNSEDPFLLILTLWTVWETMIVIANSRVFHSNPAVAGHSLGTRVCDNHLGKTSGCWAWKYSFLSARLQNVSMFDTLLFPEWPDFNSEWSFGHSEWVGLIQKFWGEILWKNIFFFPPLYAVRWSECTSTQKVFDVHAYPRNVFMLPAKFLVRQGMHKLFWEFLGCISSLSLFFFSSLAVWWKHQEHSGKVHKTNKQKNNKNKDFLNKAKSSFLFALIVSAFVLKKQ